MFWYIQIFASAAANIALIVPRAKIEKRQVNRTHRNRLVLQTAKECNTWRRKIILKIRTDFRKHKAAKFNIVAITAALLCCALLMCAPTAQAATTTAPGTVSLATVQARLNELRTTAGLFFTVSGEACNTTDRQKHGCPNCHLFYVVNATGGFRANATQLTKWPASTSVFTVYPSETLPEYYITRECKSCRAFAQFAGWYIAANKATDKIYYERVVNCRIRYAHNFAQKGDIISISGHSAIITEITETSLKVLDCNSAGWGEEKSNRTIGNCYIQEHSVPLNDKECTIARATNVENQKKFILFNQIDDAATGHIYRLYNGHCDWTTAKEYCESLGEKWHLMTVSSSSEAQIAADLSSIWGGKNDGGTAWIGAEWKGGKWTWVTEEEFSYTPPWRFSLSDYSSRPYGCIYGFDSVKANEKSQAIQGKWDGRASMYLYALAGFIAEYDPDYSNKNPYTTEYYEYSVYTATKSTNVKSYPYANSADHPSATLRSLSAGDEVCIVSACRNEYDNRWYQLQDGGFVFSGDLSFTESLRDISVSNLQAPPPSGIVNGEKFTFEGVINSTESINGIMAFIVDATDLHTVQDVYLFWPIDDGEFDYLTLSFDMDALGINEGLDTSTLENGTYIYGVIVWTGKLYDDTVVRHRDHIVEVTFEVTDQPSPTGITEIAFSRPSGSFEERLNAVMDAFPEGWYWNCWNANTIGDNYQINYLLDEGTTSISNKPCDTSHSADQRYWGYLRGTKAAGFARAMYDLTWNIVTEANSYSYRMSYSSGTANNDAYFVDYIAAGDMVYVETGKYYFVTDVSGDVITYGQCNVNGDCMITWGNTMTKQQLKAQMSSTSKNQYPGYILSPVPKDFAPTLFTYEQYVVTASSLNIKKARQPFTDNSYTTSFTISSGEKLWVATNHTCFDYSGKEWAYCQYNGKYGWIVINDASVCQKVTGSDYHFNYLSTQITLPNGNYNTDDFRWLWLYNGLSELFSGTVSGDDISRIDLSLHNRSSNSAYDGELLSTVSMQLSQGELHVVDVYMDLANQLDWVPADGSYCIRLTVTCSVADSYEYVNYFRLCSDNTVYPYLISPEFDTLKVVAGPYQNDVSIVFYPSNTTYKDMNITSDDDRIVCFYGGGNEIHIIAGDVNEPYTATLYVTCLDAEDATVSDTTLIVTVIPQQSAVYPTRVILDEGNETVYLPPYREEGFIIPVPLSFEPADSNMLQVTATSDNEDVDVMVSDENDYVFIIIDGKTELDAVITVNAINPMTACQGAVYNLHAVRCTHPDTIQFFELRDEGIGYYCIEVCTQCEQTLRDESARILVLPAAVTTIGSKAFKNLSSVDIIVIPESVTSIAPDAFAGSEVTLLVVPGSYADVWAFENDVQRILR